MKQIPPGVDPRFIKLERSSPCRAREGAFTLLGELSHDLDERLALTLSDIKLELGGLAGAVSPCKGAGTISGSTVNFGHVKHLGVAEPEGHQDHAVVNEL